MSDDATNPGTAVSRDALLPDGRPMTRKRLRELERARQAELERARAVEAERARQAELERARAVEAERARQAELERARAVEAERARQAEQEPAPRSTPAQTEPPAVTGAQRAIGATLGRPRPRGKAAVALAVLAALAVVLVPLGLANRGGGLSNDSAVGTFGSNTPSLPTVDADAPIGDVLEVAGRLGSTPVVSVLASAPPPAGILTDVLLEGDGRTVNSGDAVLLSVSVFNGTDVTNTTGTAVGTRLYRGLLDASQLGRVLAEAVEGATEGTRLVLRAPAEAADGGPCTEITVVDVLRTSANGTTREVPDGTPLAVLNADGTMTVSLNGLPAPTRPRATVLIEGDGPQVSSTDTVIARYQTVSWADAAARTDSYGWDVVPGIIRMTDTLTGISSLLVDVTVGSRVILSLPTDQARGEEPVAVVIDVLAVVSEDALTNVSAEPSPTASPEVVRVTPSATASPDSTGS
ncbi:MULTISPECIES: MAP7 domain-containing protein [Actinomyces]|uniref:Peptidylprolyl isomerase n=1 Tax=Actinomyces respiraculi TaxID=2744574 RepID=A0A7T0LIS2_9ACTO|nr:MULTISPECIES: MAP7 domain-containing protein [Actinomyces]QPL04504.1 hypothetical protein ID810_06700 [Actinomyces respiraculi]